MTKAKLAMRLIRTVFAVLAVGAAVNPVHAATYLEDFEARFPVWETDWLGVNSDLGNYLCSGAALCTNRGNNPDGLWAYGGPGGGNGQINVNFSASFASTLTSLALDVAGYSVTNLRVYDAANVLIFNAPVTLTFGALSNPGTYSHYVISSTTGISRFLFDGPQALGNTSIDNVAVATLPAVPEPSAWALMLAGLGVLGFMVRRKAQ